MFIVFGFKWLTNILILSFSVPVPNRCLSNNCHAKAICQNGFGDFACVCLHGYTGDGTTCISESPYIIVECITPTIVFIVISDL